MLNSGRKLGWMMMIHISYSTWNMIIFKIVINQFNIHIRTNFDKGFVLRMLTAKDALFQMNLNSLFFCMRNQGKIVK